MAYYDGTKLLSLRDINGNLPEIYMVTTNRTGGKTTYFGRLFINRFLKDRSKFGLLYRYDYELSDIPEKFFKDIGSLFFSDYEMRSIPICKGKAIELFLARKGSEDQGISCGYGIALNSADIIKKYSHLFSDIERLLFDEFQSETNNYCANEVKKFQSVHTSIARGQGKQYRRVPVYMLSNTVSVINPYYTAMKISHRLREDTKFLRGNGFVLEQGYVDSAAQAQKESGFFKAFEDSDYMKYTTQNIYLNDNLAFIEKPSGKSKYLCTFTYNNSSYSIREYADLGFVYCDSSFDETYPIKIAVTTSDHKVNYVMLKRNDLFIKTMRYYFDRGCFRFKDLICKEALMSLISY